MACVDQNYLLQQDQMAARQLQPGTGLAIGAGFGLGDFSATWTTGTASAEMGNGDIAATVRVDDAGYMRVDKDPTPDKPRQKFYRINTQVDCKKEPLDDLREEMAKWLEGV